MCRHWASPDNDVAVTVAIQYSSPGLERRVAPENDRQFVVVASHKSKNAEKDLVEIGAKCEKGT